MLEEKLSKEGNMRSEVDQFQYKEQNSSIKLNFKVDIRSTS